jgi:hypothetical protein
MRKFSLTPGFDPRTVQPVASRYDNWATRPTEAYVTVENFLFNFPFNMLCGMRTDELKIVLCGILSLV